jgi:hypothetical protein
MKWAALITWVITALGGFALLGIWLQRGGMQQRGEPGRRIRPQLIFGHFGLAATGLVLWIIYVIVGSDGLAWVAFVLLAVVAALGFSMFALWLQRRQSASAAAARPPDAGGATSAGSEPAEQHFPVAFVGGHGVLAAATLVLVFLTAVGVGS